MSHGHHGHAHSPARYDRAFAIGIALNVIFVAVEGVAGVLAGSLALLADAGHNLSDVLGLLLAWGATALARREPSERRTYGWRKSSILAALANALVLMVAIGGIAWEAIRRFGEPSPVSGGAIIVVAAIGLVVNTITALLFLSGRERDLNIRGAFLHMVADAGVSAGVVISGVAILLTGRPWIDPLVSLVITLVILVGTWGLLRDSFNLAMDAVPEGIEPETVRAYLAGLPGILGVHDLHIWAMSTTEPALTVHLVKPNADGDDALIARINHDLEERFGIEHSTVQWERGEDLHGCGGACETGGRGTRLCPRTDDPL